MPEPAPNPDGEKLLDSAIIEQDYATLPGLSGLSGIAGFRPAATSGIPGADPRPRSRMQPDANTTCKIAPTLQLPRPAPSPSPFHPPRRRPAGYPLQ